MEKEQQKELWEKQGECRTCGFHQAFYEVAEAFEEALDEELDILFVPCPEDGGMEGGWHKGSGIPLK